MQKNVMLYIYDNTGYTETQYVNISLLLLISNHIWLFLTTFTTFEACLWEKKQRAHDSKTLARKLLSGSERKFSRRVTIVYFIDNDADTGAAV